MIGSMELFVDDCGVANSPCNMLQIGDKWRRSETNAGTFVFVYSRTCMAAPKIADPLDSLWTVGARNFTWAVVAR